MPERIKQKKRPTDVNQLAHLLVAQSTQTEESTALPSKEQISMLMAQLGRKGGKKGGKRRLETMTANERKIIARKAAQARWAKKAR
jgi:hypothetical protein